MPGVDDGSITLCRPGVMLDCSIVACRITTRFSPLASFWCLNRCADQSTHIHSPLQSQDLLQCCHHSPSPLSMSPILEGLGAEHDPEEFSMCTLAPQVHSAGHIHQLPIIAPLHSTAPNHCLLLCHCLSHQWPSSVSLEAPHCFPLHQANNSWFNMFPLCIGHKLNEMVVHPK